MFSNKLCLLKCTPRYFKNVPEAISKPLPWVLGLAQGMWEMSNKCQSLKKAKESIPPMSMRASGSAGPGSTGTSYRSIKEGAHPTFPGRSREDRGHWGSPSPGQSASPWGQEQVCPRDVGRQAGLDQQSPRPGRAGLWELDMCCPGVPLGQGMVAREGWDGILSPGWDTHTHRIAEFLEWKRSPRSSPTQP